jgi:paraquat-inducible protein A
MKPGRLIACHECDLLQREIALAEGGKALCPRCGATLYRSHPHSVDRTLACTLGAIVLFGIANCFPIVSLELNGQRVDASLLGAVAVLYGQEMRLLAALVLATALIMPVLELAMLLALLVPLRLGRVPPRIAPLFRVLHAATPWGMIDVFMLGVLVAMVKLAHIAHAVPGIALWSFAAVMVLLAGIGASFDPRELWARAWLR